MNILAIAPHPDDESIGCGGTLSLHGEKHPDHRASIPIVRAALSLAPVPAPDLRTYEIWTSLVVYEEVADITGTMPHKLRAVRRYRSQLASFRYDRAVRGLAAYRGALAAKCGYADMRRCLAARWPRPDRVPSVQPSKDGTTTIRRWGLGRDR